MYTNVHSFTGIVIGLMGLNPIIGLSLALLSHYPLDSINEFSDPHINNTRIREGFIFLLQLLLILLTGKYILLSYIFFANLPDIIDKPLKIYFNKSPIFECHQDQWPVVYHLTYNQQFVIHFLFVLITLFIL